MPMSEELETILRLVADSRLSPEEAAPVIEALARSERGGQVDQPRRKAPVAGGRSGGRQLRIRVTERGRQVVNLRIPIGFVEAALQFVPGLAGDQSQRIRDAVRAGATGPILDIEEPDCSGVLISVD